MAPDTYGTDPQEEYREWKPASTWPSGTSTQDAVAANDIDDVERTEAKLLHDERELRRIVDLIPQTIVVLSPDGKAIYANRGALEYTGLSLDEVRADDFRDRLFHPEDVQRLREERQKALSGTAPFENEQRALGKDGKYRWFLIRYNQREREIIETALREAKGIIGGANGAAAKLGVPRQTLESKIKKLGINRYQYKTSR
jgi:PAS domain S-box-containing protein